MPAAFTPEERALWSRLLSDLAALVELLAGPEQLPMPMPAVSPPPAPAETSLRHDNPATDPVLTTLQADLLDAARRCRCVRKGILLARDCSRPWNSKAREALADLCKLGLLVRAEGGGYQASRDVVT